MQDNFLEHASKFEHVLKHYVPRVEFIDLLKSIPLVLLVAPAAAGRNTIIRNLIMTGHYRFIVSDTTRHPRINNGVPEVDGHEYWFKNENKFLDGLKHGDYIGAAIIHNQQVSGMHIEEFQKVSTENKVAITDIEIQGADSMREYKPDAHNLFILPPDFAEWIRRLESRGAIDAAEEHRRLESAVIEISTALNRPYFNFITNWDLRLTVESIHEQVTSGVFDNTRASEARQHAEELLVELQKRL